MTITLATTDADIASTHAVMNQLRPHVPFDGYVERIRRMQSTGFNLAYLTAGDGEVAAVAGFRILDQLVSGRVLYVDDLVSDERRRSSGHGAALLDWMKAYAVRENCTRVELDSGVWRAEAHKFYFRHGLTILGFHFRTEELSV